LGHFFLGESIFNEKWVGPHFGRFFSQARLVALKLDKTEPQNIKDNF
jgi:hypothetical protein